MGIYPLNDGDLMHEIVVTDGDNFLLLLDGESGQRLGGRLGH